MRSSWRLLLQGQDLPGPPPALPAPAHRMKGLSAEDMLVLQCIQGAGNLGVRAAAARRSAAPHPATRHPDIADRAAALPACACPAYPPCSTLPAHALPTPPPPSHTGIWTRDMRSRTNLAQPRVNRALKALEERGLVKAVKSVQHASRKVGRTGGRMRCGAVRCGADVGVVVQCIVSEWLHIGWLSVDWDRWQCPARRASNCAAACPADRTLPAGPASRTRPPDSSRGLLGPTPAPRALPRCTWRLGWSLRAR
jgi:hypothetical protein